jgi:hypothetical protein
MSTIVYIDYSGSTGNVAHYWKKVREIITKIGSNARYVFWDTNTQIMTYDQALRYTHSMHGRGGDNV